MLKFYFYDKILANTKESWKKNMEEIKLLNNAFRIYNLNDIPDLSKRVLDYILLRLIDNKQNFEKMIEMLKTDITFNDILNTFNDAYKENDFYKKSNSYKQGTDYYSGDFPVPIGNIVVETNNVLDVIKYFVGGIKSRNTITISQTEYYELSLSNMVLIIFVEALAKFNISRNTLMILPYEECMYEEFDEIIEIENGKVSIKQKSFSPKYVIYIEDHAFDSEVKTEMEKLTARNIDFELIDGSLESVLEKIKKKKSKGVAIYTKNSDIAYDFITLANSQNVFVNSSLLNAEELNDKTNKFYYKKKIMYPSGQKINIDEYYKEYTNKFREIKTDLFAKEKTDNNLAENNKKYDTDIENNTETSLIEVVNPWYKQIFEKIKKLFFRR